MNFKKTILVLLIGSLTVGACKKSKSVTPVESKIAFDKLTMADIVAQEAKMTTKDIPFTTAGNNIFKPGAIILYKTNENNYGKLKLISIAGVNTTDPSLTYLLTIDVITYNKVGGTTLKQQAGLKIKRSFCCDLDQAVQIATTEDFQWEAEASHASLINLNKLPFCVYSN